MLKHVESTLWFVWYLLPQLSHIPIPTILRVFFLFKAWRFGEITVPRSAKPTENQMLASKNWCQGRREHPNIMRIYIKLMNLTSFPAVSLQKEISLGFLSQQLTIAQLSSWQLTSFLISPGAPTNRKGRPQGEGKWPRTPPKSKTWSCSLANCWNLATRFTCGGHSPIDDV